MKFSVFALATLCGSLFFPLQGGEELVDSSTKESFPAEVSFDVSGKHYDLQATGVATRKKLIVKVYSIASYLQKGAFKGGDPVQAILSDDNAKQLTIKWVRGVGADQVRESYTEAFHKVLNEQQFGQLKGVLDQFLQFFAAGASKGDEFVLRWTPGGNVEVDINGKKAGAIANKDFAQGLWKIWFGEKSVVDRADLLSRLK